jgi:Ca2+:H+ antiporter
MIPAGFAVQLTNGNPALIFSLNFIAIIPLGRILSLATKDLVLRLGGLSATAVIMTFG